MDLYTRIFSKFFSYFIQKQFSFLYIPWFSLPLQILDKPIIKANKNLLTNRQYHHTKIGVKPYAVVE